MISKLLITTFIVTMLLMPLTAQGQSGGRRTDEKPFPNSCDVLNNPEDYQNAIVTVIEEQIGNAPANTPQKIGDATVIQCFRVTKGEYLEEMMPGQIEGREEGKKRWVWKDPVYAEACTSDPISADPAVGETAVLCQRIQVFIAKSGTGVLFGYLGTIYRWAAGVIGIVTVFYIIWGGIMLTTAGDNTGRVDEAKEKIIQSIAGLVLLFLSAIILYTINPNFFTL